MDSAINNSTHDQCWYPSCLAGHALGAVPDSSPRLGRLPSPRCFIHGCFQARPSEVSHDRNPLCPETSGDRSGHQNLNPELGRCGENQMEQSQAYGGRNISPAGTHSGVLGSGAATVPVRSISGEISRYMDAMNELSDLVKRAEAIADQLQHAGPVNPQVSPASPPPSSMLVFRLSDVNDEFTRQLRMLRGNLDRINTSL